MLFQLLLFGDQCLLFIVWVMVKYLSLLIFDELCNGLDEINCIKVLVMFDLLVWEGNIMLLYVNYYSEDKILVIKNMLNMCDYQFCD